MEKCIFLDRDGVLNYDDPGYVFKVEFYTLYPEVPQVLKKLKDMGYLLIVVTNQAGISKKIYTKKQMYECFQKLQDSCGNSIDDIYFSPYHPTKTKSLSRKPGTLMFERAIAKWNIDPAQSWMLGDKPSDLEPADKMGIRTLGVQRQYDLPSGTQIVEGIKEALAVIAQQSQD